LIVNNVILIAGVLLGVWGLVFFLKKASLKDIAALLMIVGIVTMSSTFFYLTITGKLPIIFAVMSIFWPIVFNWLRQRKERRLHSLIVKPENREEMAKKKVSSVKVDGG
jgi:vacuolar-type H+-ATPase subunit I/STV1